MVFSDLDLLNEFLAIQDKLEPTMAIEVGAYDGDFSRAIVKRNIPTYAFEGSPYVYERFKEHMTEVNYINKAITDFDGYVTFNIEHVNQAASVGHNGIKGGRWGTEAFVDVPCTSLDSYFKDINDQRITMWIDCEGANKEVLEGGIKLLSMTDSILIEVEHSQLWKDIWTRQNVIDYLDSQGFGLYKEYPAYHDQTNCLFIRKSHFGRV